MPANGSLTFYHCPNSRSAGVRVLLEELGAPYELVALNLKTGETRQDKYLAVNPMGKVPAIVHNGALITEQPAIYIYLADLFAEAGLAPQMGDPLRGPYLRWMVFYGSCFEPALVDKAMQREAAPPSTSPYGDQATMLKTLTDQLSQGPYILGEKFTAADVLWGGALNWTTMFNIVERTPLIGAYIDRVLARPAFARAKSLDEGLVVKQG